MMKGGGGVKFVCAIASVNACVRLQTHRYLPVYTDTSLYICMKIDKI